MDPFTIAVVLTIAGMLGVGLDFATGGRVRAELFGGARGAAGYARSAGTTRWREAQKVARQERMKTPFGRAMQFVLDETGAAGKGLVRGWRSGARSARTRWQEAHRDQPLPIVRLARSGAEWARTKLRRDPNGDPNRARCSWTEELHGLGSFGLTYTCGQPATEGPFYPEHAQASRVTPCPQCGEPMGTGTSCSECRTLRILRGEDGPYGPNEETEPDPNDLGPLPPKCPDCGMPIVVSTLEQHRLGKDHCPYADPNEEPALDDDDVFVPMDKTIPHHTPSPRTEGPTTVADINSAPAAIAAMEQHRNGTEEIEALSAEIQRLVEQLINLVSARQETVAQTADSMGDFAIGGESDLAGAFTALRDRVASAQEATGGIPDAVTGSKEALDGYLSALHLEYDASIEAASAKQAGAHRPMQEV